MSFRSGIRLGRALGRRALLLRIGKLPPYSTAPIEQPDNSYEARCVKALLCFFYFKISFTHLVCNAQL